MTWPWCTGRLTCDRPPRGWTCRQPYGHNGPCPTRPTGLNRLRWWKHR